MRKRYLFPFFIILAFFTPTVLVLLERYMIVSFWLVGWLVLLVHSLLQMTYAIANNIIDQSNTLIVSSFVPNP